jgi:23S rRNA (adenine1618-N6)-methyltransferase
VHPRNPHQGRYNFEALVHASPELTAHLQPTPTGEPSIDFSDAGAVLCLNRALLAHYYGVQHWMIPAGYLCPPVPGRADYIHCLADLLGRTDSKQSAVRVLDIGTGANCIYPILGRQSYGWKFVGSEIDPVAVKGARAIVAANPCLSKHVRIVHQKNAQHIFTGVIKPSDRFELTMCNPPFHASAESAESGNQRKQSNLNRGRASTGAAQLNFGGQANELWCAGGEVAFIRQMIQESAALGQQVKWFTTLVSKSEHLSTLEQSLKHIAASEVKILPMRQGQKISRILAWRC